MVEELIARLRARAEKVSGYITNNNRVIELMQPELDRFEAREGHNIYATRLAVDHKSSNRSLAKELTDWTEAADTLASQARQIGALREAAKRALNFIENTESELGITLDCGDLLRATLEQDQ